MAESITVEVLVNAPIEKTWQAFNDPEAMKAWGHPSDDWHTTKASNDLRAGGKLAYRMEAKDGSAGFDLEAVYGEVSPPSALAYKMGDDRRVRVTFTKEGSATRVTETFDAESENPVEMQRGGWQAILDNFKKYAEALQ